MGYHRIHRFGICDSFILKTGTWFMWHCSIVLCLSTGRGHWRSYQDLGVHEREAAASRREYLQCTHHWPCQSKVSVWGKVAWLLFFVFYSYVWMDPGSLMIKRIITTRCHHLQYLHNFLCSCYAYDTDICS